MKNKAFTLIELMLTVMIIAILVSIAIPNYINTVERAKAREARATLESIRAAEQSYAAERRAFIAPGNDAEWNAIGLENPNTVTNASWTYTVTTGPLSIQASRKDGPYAFDTINLDENGVETTTGTFY